MKELIKELEQYKTLNKIIDIDFVIILIKIHLNNYGCDCNAQILTSKTKQHENPETFLQDATNISEAL
jgi:hypothetical protein